MRVVNFSSLAGKLEDMIEDVRFGDHTLHFEHEEDLNKIAMTGMSNGNTMRYVIRGIIFCENCDSEKVHERLRSNIQVSGSAEAAFIEIFNTALTKFISEVPESCHDAHNLNLCEAVLTE